MMLACFCLNITIETAPNDFQTVTPEYLGLSDEEKGDQFFKQDIQKVGHLVCISKVHSCLVKKRNVGAWTISQCINCDCHTHAVHQQKGASMVVIYSKLLNPSAISSVKSSDIFSTIFNIVVNPNDIGEEDKNAETYRYFPPLQIEKSLRSIKEIMAEYIRKESLAVEQRIKKYSEEQYEELNYLKDRAYKEHESLVRVICSAIASDPESTKKLSYGFFTPKATSSRPAAQTDMKHSDSSASPSTSISVTASRIPQKRDKSSPRYSESDELIFDFEIDDANSVPSTDVDESDREDREEGISIPKSATPARPSMAKSLPMDIPAFIAKPKQSAADDLDDASPVGENVDIAASIKALAKSVHGDPVFGDLPRPRFSTQI